MPDTFLFANGAWRKAQDVYVNAGGNWVQCKEVWTNVNGGWNLVFKKGFTFNPTISGYDYNLYNDAINNGWDGVTPLIANVTVSGVLGCSGIPTIDWNTYVAANPDLAAAGASYKYGQIAFAQRNLLQFGARQMYYNMPAPAFDTGNLPANSQVTLTVNGGSFILGSGGQGGFGGVWNDSNGQYGPYPSTPGAIGGTAIRASYPLTIINNGTIAGGGGGGGGGAGGPGGEAYDDPGSAGGGGGGVNNGPGGGSSRSAFSGQPGNNLQGGNPGTLSNQGSKEWNTAASGGRGGDVGNGGSAGGNTSGSNGAPGGPSGIAVQYSGNVAWQVYGDVRGPLS